MVITLTALLLISSAAMIALLYVKHWELTTGRVVVSDLRPQIDSFFHRVLFFVEAHIPRLLQTFWKRALQWLRVTALGTLARGLIIIEHWLERALQTLRYGIVPPPNSEGQVSTFLKEVSDHKKRLMRRPLQQRMIKET